MLKMQGLFSDKTAPGVVVRIIGMLTGTRYPCLLGYGGHGHADYPFRQEIAGKMDPVSGHLFAFCNNPNLCPRTCLIM